MLETVADLFERTKNIDRSAYIWNAVNAMLSALQAPLVLMVVTRTNGIDDAGVFSIAFAVANLLLYVGHYGLRRYQASDVAGQFSFADYHGMRLITCGIMILCSIIYVVYGSAFNSYSPGKSLVVLLICGLKLIQAYTDVIHGDMQRKGRLDVATKCSAVRYVSEIMTMCLMLFLFSDLFMASAVTLAVSVLVMMVTTVNTGKRYAETYRPGFESEKIRSLAVDGFPLFASLFLNMYISNAPKYAIDAYLSEEIQAKYNMIFMPAFMVMLLSFFIFNPLIKSYAELWQSEDRSEKRKLLGRIKGQSLFVAGITVAGLVVAATIGIPVLSFIFGADLSQYRTELVIVMLGGGALAYSQYFSIVITIIREQKLMIVCYAAASLCAFVLSRILVVGYGITGAAILYAVIMVVLSALLGAIMLVIINKNLKEES